MSWLSITTNDVKAVLTSTEHSAMQTQFVEAGQEDPIAAIITQVVAEIRGYIGAGGYDLSAIESQLPANLVSCALSIVRYRLLTRLPSKTLITDDRKADYDGAIKLLERVADGKFSVDSPVSGSQGGPTFEQASTPTRIATRSKLDGL